MNNLLFNFFKNHKLINNHFTVTHNLNDSKLKRKNCVVLPYEIQTKENIFFDRQIILRLNNNSIKDCAINDFVAVLNYLQTEIVKYEYREDTYYIDFIYNGDIQFNQYDDSGNMLYIIEYKMSVKKMK